MDPPSEYNYQCDICENSFKTRENLIYHVDLVHKKKYQVICEELINGEPCNRLFCTTTILNNHKEARHVPKKCEHCDLIFPDAYAFDEHFQATHQAIFHCKNRQYCNKRFATKEALDAHVCKPLEHKIRCSFQIRGHCDQQFKLGDKRGLRGALDNYGAHLVKVHGLSKEAKTKLLKEQQKRREQRPGGVGLEPVRCEYEGTCNAPMDDIRIYRTHLTTKHKVTGKAQDYYTENLTTTPGTAFPQASDAIPLPPPPPPDEPRFVEPPHISLDPNFTLTCWKPNTYTSGRIQVRFDPSRLNPAVVYQRLDADYTKHPNFVRGPQSYTKHPDIPNKEQLGASDYTNSGFDRGHMARKRNHMLIFVNYKASFYYAYMCPQYPLFNNSGGLWYRSETRELKFCGEMNITHSYGGPGYKPFMGVVSFQLVRMHIPSFFFKILLGERKGDDSFEMECYAFPHKNEKNDQPLTDFFIELEDLDKLVDLKALDVLQNFDMKKLKRFNHRTITN